MDELLKQLSTILRGMWKYRRLGVAVCWVVALVGAVLVFMMQDRYEASARVYVDTQTILRPLMSGFHGFYSVGGIAGAGCLALLMSLGVPAATYTPKIAPASRSG